MGRSFDLGQLKQVLEDEFAQALAAFRSQKAPVAKAELLEAAKILFESKTQAFREVLLGCCLVRIADQKANLRLPYSKQAADAFPGREIDENVVNPFLQREQVPCTKGPYLSVFRRDARFVSEKRTAMRDKKSYDAFLVFVDFLTQASGEDARATLRLLLAHFLALREAGRIELTRIQRLSLDQLVQLIKTLLETPSGGLIPVLVSVAMFETLRQSFHLPWCIQFQGINAADKASGAGGDITIAEGEKIVLAVEVTERSIDRNRVVSTFNTKIAPQGITDYLFLFTSAQPEAEARKMAGQYFGQGHDVSFMPVSEWASACLGTIGANGRGKFIEEMLGLLSSAGVPSHTKIAWNQSIASLLA